jgi:hypothetical protein
LHRVNGHHYWRTLLHPGRSEPEEELIDELERTNNRNSSNQGSYTCLTIGALLPSFTWADPDEMQTEAEEFPTANANQDVFFIMLAVLLRRAEDFRSIL